MSAYSVAREAINTALSQSDAEGVDAETTLRALLGTITEQYRELKGVSDLKAVLQFELHNASGSEEYEFTRP
ncbi:MAG: hypothetical protein NXH85_09680 [Pseudomonadaceae bacterium]|nr:hypothetical protein [Pseudomonadaceae bacterium]